MLPLNHIWLMQPAPTEKLVPSAGGGNGQPAPVSAAPDSMFMNIMPLAVMFVLFYFLLIRPQQKRQKETDTMLKALQKGDRVRTTGGIRGEITELTDTEVTLQIDTKVRINVLRSHIAGRVEKAGGEAKA